MKVIGEDPTDSTRHKIQDPAEWFVFYEVGVYTHLVGKGRIPATIKKLYSMP
ncbi:MAG: hypothetical protein ACI8ZB_002094 [Desulforhopalus sp.]|jgi:hypothetical protein